MSASLETNKMNTQIQQQKNHEEALVGLKRRKKKQARTTQSIWALWQRALTAEFGLPAKMYCLVMWKETDKLTSSEVIGLLRRSQVTGT